MSLKHQLETEIQAVLAHAGYDGIRVQLSYTPDHQVGDLTSTVGFQLAKIRSISPLQAAQELADQLRTHQPIQSIISSIEVVAPGFINITIKQVLKHAALNNLLSDPEHFGANSFGQGQTVIIEYSSPNIAKYLHVGHLRSTVIGQALVHLFRHVGYTVIADCHLGDWGTQFGKLLAAYKQVHGEHVVETIDLDELETIYREYNTLCKTDQQYLDRAKQELKKLQEGDPLNGQLWRLFRQESLHEIEQTIYTPLGIAFDTVIGESFFYDLPVTQALYENQPTMTVEQVVADALKRSIAMHSNGAVIIPFDDDHMIPMVIEKSDGAYLYATSDLATAHYRTQTYHPAQVLYVIGMQELHLSQVMVAAKKLGYVPEQTILEHINYGIVLGANGKKMSTREGNTATAVDLLDESIQRAATLIQEKNPEMDEQQLKHTAELVGVAALKYADLSRDRMTNITFDWESMMNITGGSAVYLLYTFARIQSLKKKISIDSAPDWQYLTQPAEQTLCDLIVLFEDIVLDTVTTRKPNVLATYLEQLAAGFHAFYEACPIKDASDEVKAARLGLSTAVGNLMQVGLGLLGIKTVDRL